MPALAEDLIQEALDTLKSRAALRDSPEGERSMEGCITAFNSVTGNELSVIEGWIFMILLKIARSRQGEHHRDDYIDIIGYAGLLAEAAESGSKQGDNKLKEFLENNNAVLLKSEDGKRLSGDIILEKRRSELGLENSEDIDEDKITGQLVWELCHKHSLFKHIAWAEMERREAKEQVRSKILSEGEKLVAPSLEERGQSVAPSAGRAGQLPLGSVRSTACYTKEEEGEEEIKEQSRRDEFFSQLWGSTRWKRLLDKRSAELGLENSEDIDEDETEDQLLWKFASKHHLFRQSTWAEIKETNDIWKKIKAGADSPDVGMNIIQDEI